MPGSAFKMKGQPTNYVKTTADSGNPRVQAFCPKCGSPIYSTSPGEGQQASYMVRVGILAQRDQLAPKQQNWFRSARDWVTEWARSGTRSRPRLDRRGASTARMSPSITCIGSALQ